MSPLHALREHARANPTHLAIEDAGGRLDYAGLHAEVAVLAARLRGLGLRTLAWALPNGAPWAVTDLAALAAGLVAIPLPPFFAADQTRHCLGQAGAEALILPAAALGLPAFRGLAGERIELTIAGAPLLLVRLPFRPHRAIPPLAAKITYTSGTTGTPKGVLLSAAQMERIAVSLAAASGRGAGDRHLCVAPLAVLLENIAGLYAPLLVGAEMRMPPLDSLGVLGAAGLDGGRFAQALADSGAASAILSPALLQGLVEALEGGATQPEALRFLAVGGAAVPVALLGRAAALGLPVFQGYGLSECASVVTLNRPGADRPGSAGQALAPNDVRIDAQGEIQVRGNLFLGYLGKGAPVTEDGWWRTGDLGHLDADGYLAVTGRIKNLIVTAFGRNLSPEWVEQALTLEPPVAQAALFGDGRPWNLALITPAPGADAESIDAAIARVNQGLPDYARVRRWLPADQPFSPLNGLLTGTGRLRRAALSEAYGARIELTYREHA